MKTKARVIAIYLPQYHPIPENDEVWGKGFTEWTNVAQAKPLFKGHYQPRIPRDFGYYDLRLPEVREMQAEYARNAGIEGFMYWQYYFGNGKKLLERPFEEVLASGKPDFPFCLGWANHSWQTKTWKRDALKKEGQTMIMEQRYDGEQQYVDHFIYNLPAFKDKRYICVDGKPVFLIWNPMDHPDQITLLIKTWRKLAIENGLQGIHFIGSSNGINSTSKDIIEMGFDAVYLVRNMMLFYGDDKTSIKHRLSSLIRKIADKHILNKADFAKKYKLLTPEEAKEENKYPVLLAGYDRSPRAGKKAHILYNFTPIVWREHIQYTLNLIKDKKQENNLVFIKSWNEWGESNYIEPDLRYGTAMLDTLKEEIIIGNNADI